MDKDDLYVALHKNSYYLPLKSSSMCTVAWMKDVAHGRAYCFSYEDIRLRPCPVPPKKDVLVAELNEAMK